MANDQRSLKQLFQDEFAKMVAVISNHFGLQHIELAEDIVSETFLQAAETWGVKGTPENPPAWLYAVAKQKTLYHFRRNKIFEQKIVPELRSVSEKENYIDEINFSHQHIRDSQLQMLFAVCNPAIASEAQIGLALRILCGFGIEEIAEAFLSNKETINKRLFRAKEKLRSGNIKMELPADNEVSSRLENVLHVIYLLFNEGYYSKTQNEILRKELCIEAMRLGLMLTEYERTNVPRTNALMALMCFHASRFDARQTTENAMVLYEQQDESAWNYELIERGIYFLNLSAAGTEITSYHLEAGIAHWHCKKDDSIFKWQEILKLYDKLLLANYSPAVALNRVFAVYKVHGAAEALKEAKALDTASDHFYYLLLAELYKHIDKGEASIYYKKAYDLAKTEVERKLIKEKMNYSFT